MELEWLADLLAVVECGGFSRAAGARNITQPALSRRIRALEAWVGAPLFERTTHKVELTPAGAAFQPVAAEILRRAAEGRREAQEQANARFGHLRFAATNALAINAFPQWWGGIEPKLPFVAHVELEAGHAAACERMLREGQVQFLLGHHAPGAETALGPEQFLSWRVGEDVLVPLVAPGRGGAPRFALPGCAAAPVPYLAYGAESGMGRIVATLLARPPAPLHLRPIFSTHVAKLLVAMALEGRGVAWLMQSLVAEQVAAGELVRAGDAVWDIPVEIRLFRPHSRLSPAAETFWKSLDALAGAQAKNDSSRSTTSSGASSGR